MTSKMPLALAAPYLLSLCEAVEYSDFSFGVVSRFDTQKSNFELDAAKLIHSIVKYSPASEFVAMEFLFELQKIWGINDSVAAVVRLQSDIQPEQWAKQILAFLRIRPRDELKLELKPILDLATEYLNHLLIARGEKTPQDSTHPTPDILQSHNIIELLNDATINRKQSALKTLVYKRDGYHCPLTGYSFKPFGRHVNPRCAHIVPFSFRDKHLALRTLESFTGRAITADFVRDKINHPSNAFNVENNAHDSFDKLAWGIEAMRQPGGEHKYIFRVVRDAYAATVRLEDGDEIVFCKGDDGQIVDAPNPSFCNLKLAIARVMYASGVLPLIDELYGDDDDNEAIVNQPVYLGGSFVSDDTLFRRLYDRLPVSSLDLAQTAEPDTDLTCKT